MPQCDRLWLFVLGRLLDDGVVFVVRIIVPFECEVVVSDVVAGIVAIVASSSECGVAISGIVAIDATDTDAGSVKKATGALGVPDQQRGL